MKLVRLEPEAAEELREAAQWYNERRPELGEDLLRRVTDALNLIARLPETGAPFLDIDPNLGVRRFPIRRFPYHVVYLETANDIRVLAVAHEKRKPGYWQSRM